MCRGPETVGARYPFPRYADDWPALVHPVTAVAFHGPHRDPVRSVRIVGFGVITRAGITPRSPRSAVPSGASPSGGR